jgi:hypothetical protein
VSAGAFFNKRLGYDYVTVCRGMSTGEPGLLNRSRIEHHQLHHLSGIATFAGGRNSDASLGVRRNHASKVPRQGLPQCPPRIAWPNLSLPLLASRLAGLGPENRGHCHSRLVPVAIGFRASSYERGYCGRAHRGEKSGLIHAAEYGDCFWILQRDLFRHEFADLR